MEYEHKDEHAIRSVSVASSTDDENSMRSHSDDSSVDMRCGETLGMLPPPQTVSPASFDTTDILTYQAERNQIATAIGHVLHTICTDHQPHVLAFWNTQATHTQFFGPDSAAFCSQSVVPVTIQYYVKRLWSHSHASTAAWVGMMFYLDQL